MPRRKQKAKKKVKKQSWVNLDKYSYLECRGLTNHPWKRTRAWLYVMPDGRREAHFICTRCGKELYLYMLASGAIDDRKYIDPPDYRIPTEQNVTKSDLRKAFLKRFL